MELKNVMNEMKNATESINRIMDQTEYRMCEIKYRNFESMHSEKKKDNLKKKKKIFVIYGIPSKQPICKLLESRRRIEGKGSRKPIKKKK